MRALGWKWVRQTVGEVENNRRRLTTGELFGVALALETSLPRLLEPLPEDEWVQIPTGESLPVSVFSDLVRGRALNDLSWYANKPMRSGRAAAALAFEEKWPDDQKPADEAGDR